MPFSPTTFMRSTALLLLVGFLALLAIVGTTIWLVEQNQRWFDETTEARVARAATVNLRTALLDMETGQRGFLLTGEERYLEPYNKALPQTPGYLDRLDEILAPYPEATQPMADIRGAVSSKLKELASSTELARNGQREQAIALVRSDTGKEAMDKAREL
ncbi:MAG TPA: CHASE3 domain-containing protein, partial [Devosia sp.]